MINTQLENWQSQEGPFRGNKMKHMQTKKAISLIVYN